MPQAIMTILPMALSGVSFLSNWINNRKTMERQNFLESLSKDPKKMNAYVSQFSKPLDEGLVKGTENQVQAALGERGLTGSPTISADVFAQALGPLQQREQQMGIDEAMASLGIMPTGGLPQSDPTLPLLLAMNRRGGGGGYSGDGSGYGGPSESDFNLESFDPYSFNNISANLPSFAG